MQISRSEHLRFLSQVWPAQKEAGHLRLGQAWYNHFKLQAHTPASPEERLQLDRIHAEKNPSRACALIEAQFVASDLN